MHLCNSRSTFMQLKGKFMRHLIMVDCTSNPLLYAP